MKTGDSSEYMESLVEQVVELIVNARRVVVFTGAGISTESGIPDFRSPGGIWERFDPEEFTYQQFLISPESRKKHWQLLGSGQLHGGAEPNPAHYAIAELERLGKLDCVITQNVDNLHRRAGVPEHKVFELHGNMQWTVCLGCGRRYPFAEVSARVAGGEEEPVCEVCRGLLKPDVVMFGEQLPERVFREAIRYSRQCDLFLVIGSSLVVTPAAYMPVYAVEAGARLVIINLSETPMDGQAAVTIRAKAGEAMPKIVRGVSKRING